MRFRRSKMLSLQTVSEFLKEIKKDAGTKFENLSSGICAPKETRMPGGTIKRLVRDRGFGFIRDDGGQEWFFHRSSVQGSFDSLNEGQRVTFDEEPSAKGPRAGNVRSE
jgi:CspA family cold shock protein